MTDESRLRPPWWESPRVAGWASLGPGALALAIGLWQLSLPNVLHGVFSYDDGVYFGSSLALVRGVIPYRDFVFVAPPGITVLMVPFALAAKAVGAAAAMSAVRVFTAVVSASCAVLVGVTIRERGIVAVVAAGIAMACYPAAFFANTTLLLEPYLVLFCLIGVVLAFSRGEIASSPRLLAAGVAFGFAGAIKVWAVVPFAVLAVVVVPRWRRAVLRLVGGAAIGFGVPVAGFAALGPGAFWHDTVITQLSRARSAPPMGVPSRLANLAGLGFPLGVQLSSGEVVAITLATGAGLGAILLVARRVHRAGRLEAFFFLAMAATTVALLVPPTFYQHYGYFVAPFAAATAGLASGHLASALTHLVAPRATVTRARGAHLSPDEQRSRRRSGPVVAASLVAVGAIAVASVIGAAALRRSTEYTRTWFAVVAYDPGPSIAAAVPKGACVVTDSASLTIMANRFSLGITGCPSVLDSFGTWIAADPAHPPTSGGPRDPALVASWKRWLGAADFVVMHSPMTFRIPWTPSLRSWFNANFAPVAGSSAAIYKRYRVKVARAA